VTPNRDALTSRIESLQRQLRAVIQDLEAGFGKERAGAATLPILAAISEIDELKRWSQAQAEIGGEPFNLSPEELQKAWEDRS